MPRSSREKSAETRSNIIDAAYRLFVERGYSATSMREISTLAGVTVGAIYNHFATKEEIYTEVLLTRHPIHDILPHILAAEGDTIADVVRTAARGMVQELLKRPDLFNLLFIELVEFKAKHLPAMVEAFLPRLMDMPKVFQGKRGRVRDLPVPILIRSFAGLFFSFYVTGIFFRGVQGIDVDETSLDRFVDLYLYGILADGPELEEA